VTPEHRSSSALAGLAASPLGRPVASGDAVLRGLEAAGAELCFGLPDGVVLPLYDSLARDGEARVIDAKVIEGEMLYPMIQPGSAGVDVLEHPVR
jgi:glyoxylate carboligase